MAKIPIHCWSDDGSILPLALTLQREGHPVTLFTKAPEARRLGAGLLPRASTPPPGALVIFDTTGQGNLGTRYRKAGHRVIGGNPLEQQLEVDRPSGMRIMAQAGIAIPPTFPFSTIPAAVKFMDKSEGRWFVKVSGPAAECCATYDAPTPEDMIRYLRWVESKGKVEPFELQQAVTGTEVSCNGWFNGHEFVPPFEITLEEKHFLAGNLGPRTGCESCVVWHTMDDTLAEATVLKIEDRLEKAGYVGPVDVNSKIDEDGEPVGLEFTARLGFDSTQAWMRLFDGDLGEQLDAFAAGELSSWEPAEVGRLSATLRVSVPPYPSFNEKMVKELEDLPLDPGLLGDRFVDPVDVKQGPVCAGAHGWIGTVGAIGTSLRELREDLKQRAGDLLIPNKQYRTDPLGRCDRDMAALQRHGLLGLDRWSA